MTPYKNGTPKSYKLVRYLDLLLKKWVVVHDQSDSAQDRYIPSKKIRFKTSVLRPDLCHFSVHILFQKERLLLQEEVLVVERIDTKNKNNAPFIRCILKINNALIDKTQDLDVAMPMYNLIEYSKNYRRKTGTLRNYYRDEFSDDTNDNNNNPNKNVINSESFKYKTIITGSTYNVDGRITNTEGNVANNPAYDANKSNKKEVEIAVPLKHQSNFWRALKMSLINCELSLTWPRECIITSMEKREVTNTRRDTSPTNATFQITDTKLYVSVVTLSTEDDNSYLQQ